MTASARDREYMQRQGEHQREGADARLAEHLGLSLEGRLRRSLELAWLYAPRMRDRPRDDTPEKFYERARALGLYRP
jgi:hypothetical protein